MTTITSDSPSSTTNRRNERPKPIAELRSFWRLFFARTFDPYRPELHYMRGPGPACRAKQTATSRLHSA